MSIDTRTHQQPGDTAPEGREPDAREDVPSQVSYDPNKRPPHPDDDALPLDGSLTWTDSEPENQTGQHPDAGRILAGGESATTAGAAIQNAEGTDRAVAANNPQATQEIASPDPQVGQVATGGH